MNRHPTRSTPGKTAAMWLVVSTGLLLGACASDPSAQRQADLDTDGISGTGIYAQSTSNGDGLSGTGMMAAAGGDGIGGTGAVMRTGGDGIGGTGILGTISGFGSIIVNGLKLDYDTDTNVKSDGQPASLTDLKVGQVIEGVARRDGRDLKLEHLEIQHAVTGPIESINTANSTLVVLGQTVSVNIAGDADQRNAFEELKPGDIVRVSGLRRDNGTVVATRLDQKTDDGRVLIRGTASAFTNGTFNIGNLTVPAEQATMTELPNAGGKVLVTGRMLGGNFNPEIVVAKPLLPFGENVRDVYIEGYLPDDSSNTALTIQDIPVTGMTTPRDVEPGDRIVVSGRIGADGSIVAQEIAQVRTVITLLRMRTMMRPSIIRPERVQRPERLERPQVPDRPARPERPQIERPGGYRPPQV